MTTPGERLRADRKRAGLSGAELANRASMVLGRNKPLSESAVRNQENGTNGIKPAVAEAYATVLRTNPARYLVADVNDSSSSGVQPMMRRLREVPVLGEARAGHFQTVRLDVEEWDELKGDETVSVDLPQFDRTKLIAFRVVGRSMDREYPEGTRVICCRVQDIGIREGDHVIVRRPGRGGDELTIKEVVLEAGGVALWPRSTDPAYQTPIRIPFNRAGDEGPEIVAVVVSSQKNRPAQQGPLIQFQGDAE